MLTLNDKIRNNNLCVDKHIFNNKLHIYFLKVLLFASYLHKIYEEKLNFVKTFIAFMVKTSKVTLNLLLQNKLYMTK